MRLSIMMNKFTELNPGEGGSIMDETGIVYSISGEPTDRRRSRIILAGENIDDITQIKNNQITGDEYGIITRNIPACPSGSIVVYDTVSLVVADLLTVVATYTVPAINTFYFIGFSGTGDLPAVYRIYIDGMPQFSLRTTASSPNVNMIFDSPPFKVDANAIITLEVIHYTTGINGDFEGSILGFIT